MAMISPEKLRGISWIAFKAMTYCAVVGFLVLVAIPAPGFRSSASVEGRILAILAVASIGAAVIANIVSLVTGAIAWAKGTRHCAWIVVCLLLLLPVAALVAWVLIGSWK